jgi:hypothetical protein
MNIIFHCIGTSNCRIFEENLKLALNNMGVDQKVKLCSDREKMSLKGVNSFPGLEVNGEILVQGKLLPVKDIETLLHEKLETVS